MGIFSHPSKTIRLGCRAIFYGALIYTLVVAMPRVHFGSLPPSIQENSLNSLSQTVSKLRSVDLLVLKIDTLGGSVAEFERLAKSMEETRGTVICTISYRTASAGAMIMQLCDKVLMNTKAKALFHMPRYFERDKAEDGSDRVTIKVITNKPRNIFEWFVYLKALNIMERLNVKETLTNDQWNRMLAGEDITIGFNQLKNKNPQKYIGWI